MYVRDSFKNLINNFSGFALSNSLILAKSGHHICSFQSFDCHVNILRILKNLIVFLYVSVIEPVHLMEALLKALSLTFICYSLLHNESLSATFLVNGECLLFDRIPCCEFVCHFVDIFKSNLGSMNDLIILRRPFRDLSKVITLSLEETLEVFSGKFNYIVGSLTDDLL